MKNIVWFLLFISCSVITFVLPNFNFEKAQSVSADNSFLSSSSLSNSNSTISADIDLSSNTNSTVSADTSVSSNSYSPILLSTETEFSSSDYSVVTTIEDGYDLSYVNNTLLASNTLTKEILDYTNSLEYALNYSPTAIANDYHEKTYFARNGLYGLCSIQTTTEENPTVTLFSDYYDNTNNIKSIGTVYDLACDVYGTAYAIAYNSSNEAVIIYKEKDGNDFYLYQELGDLTLNTTTKIQTSLDNNFILFHNDGNIYKTSADIESFELATSTTTLSNIVYTLPKNLGTVTDIKLDFHDTLFILATANSIDTLYRCDKNSAEWSDVSTTLFANSIGIALDFTEGYIYSLTDYNIVKFKLMANEINFINVVETDNSPDYINTQLETTLIYTLVDNVPLYMYDNALYIKTLNGNQITFAKDTTLFALSHSTNGYYFVLITNLANQNITGYVKDTLVDLLVLTQSLQAGRITIPNTEVFNYPTSLDNLNKQSAGENVILSKNDSITVANLAFGDADYNGISFARIQFSDNTFGYISIDSFTTESQNTIQPIVVANARTTDTVIVYNDENCTTELTQLSAGTDIEIIEQSNGIAKITWGLGTIVGYISTENLTTDQISQMQLIGLILMSISILLAIVLICFISTKKETTSVEAEVNTEKESIETEVKKEETLN